MTVRTRGSRTPGASTAARLRQLQRARVTVGVHSDEGAAAANNAPGMTVGQIAEIHELGLGSPQRSFIRAWVDGNGPRNEAIIRQAAEAVARGDKTVEQALNLVGTTFVGDVQQRIANGIQPPLKQATIDQRRRDFGSESTTPLIATSQLKSAITYKVKT